MAVTVAQLSEHHDELQIPASEYLYLFYNKTLCLNKTQKYLTFV